MIPTLRTARFLRAYLRDGAGPFRQEEIRVEIGGEPREATLYLPERRGGRPAPGWVVLHGLTVPGRHHRAMTRFVRSLAATGAAVLVPDVPAWRQLRLDVDAARTTLADASHWLSRRPEVQPGGVGTIGFSFGATQALMAMADPAVQRDVRAVVGFGGYCDLQRMLRCLFTGEHEWNGERFLLDPDPYGRWIIVGNYLTLIEGYEEMHAVARGALELAVEAGRVGAWAWEPVYDPTKARIRAGLSPAERELWDVIAPPSGSPPADMALAHALGEAFSVAAPEKDPGLDPRAHLGNVRGRVVLSHGREDRLIPFTETLRLQTLLPPAAKPAVTITGLFAHSSHAGWMHPLDRVRENGLFIHLLNDALAAV
jgi:pimeloyl-ACP methyl ester carboxylesterase